MPAQAGEEGRKCQSPGPLPCFCPHGPPWAGLWEASQQGGPHSAGGLLGPASGGGGHCLWVLSDPLPVPPTHNPIDIPTPSSGPVTMATVFSVALHQFLGKSFFLPPSFSLSFSPPSARISTYSWCPPCPACPSFCVSHSLSICPHLLPSKSLSTGPLPSLPFPAHDCSNKLESVDQIRTPVLLISGPRSREAWRDRVRVPGGPGLRPMMQR